jgi:subtilase family serine protease
LPDSPLANVPMTITVDIANLTYSTIEGFFDVNVYVDPVRPPTLGRPGDSLQWVDGIGPTETRTMTFVITLIGLGDHEVWAFVDATNAVDNERDEDNNRSEPVSTFAGCEE